MRGFATQLRESAELGIVKAYRQSLEGEGDGPSDVDLRVFARLVTYEIKLERRLAAAALSRAQALEVPAPDQPAPAPMPVQRQAETATVASPAPRARRAMPGAMLASSCLLMVCAAMASWVVGNRSESAAPTEAVVSQALVSPASPPPFVAVEQTAASQADSFVFDASAVSGEPRATGAPTSIRKAPRKPPVLSASVRAAERAREARSGSLVASCGTLNFLSRAVCMNNVCAQPGLTNSRSCADAVRQRRIDEARRNPTLMG